MSFIRWLTMTKDTKLLLIKTGAELIHRQGFNNTGIQEILKASGVPKGSFYFYFKNKEDFGIHVIEYFISQFDDMVQNLIHDDSLSPLERLKKLFKNFNSFFETHHCTCGCPIGNLSQEMGDLSNAFRLKLSEAIDKMADLYCNILQEAQDKGEISSSLDTRETAYFLVSSWQGALMRMKVVKNMQPLYIWQEIILTRVLAK